MALFRDSLGNREASGSSDGDSDEQQDDYDSVNGRGIGMLPFLDIRGPVIKLISPVLSDTNCYAIEWDVCNQENEVNEK